jgi:hypothetical protein
VARRPPVGSRLSGSYENQLIVVTTNFRGVVVLITLIQWIKGKSTQCVPPLLETSNSDAEPCSSTTRDFGWNKIYHRFIGSTVSYNHSLGFHYWPQDRPF